MSFKVLDCTIRDGGHICNWEFDEQCVRSSYFAALRSGSSYFEIGYRNPEYIKGLGKFAYCEDEFLLNLISPSSECKLTVMIDTGKAENNLFKECDPNATPIKAVRVAAYPYELKKAISLLENIKDKGYEVFLNLMACSELSDSDYKLLEDWNNKHIVNAITFADSFGSFITSDITKYFRKLRSVGFTSIGFHAHNNLQMAFANTLQALDEGASLVDASVFGMGRGAGNLPIEVLIAYFEKNGYLQYNTVPYLDNIDRFYLDLFEKYRWGYSLPSFMSGIKNIHPYYIKALFENKVFTADEAWNALDTIKNKCPISYSKDQLNETLQERFYTPLTQEKANQIYEEIKNELKMIPSHDAFLVENFEYKDMYKGKKFLIIANGPSIRKYKDQIDKFIFENDCICIGVNNLKNLFKPDYHVFISKKRFLNSLEYIDPDSVLLIPSFWGREIVEMNYFGKHSFFNIECQDNIDEVEVCGTVQKCSNLNVTISAMLLAQQMGASEVYAVGIDGYFEETNNKEVYFYNENDVVEDKATSAVRYEKFSIELDKVNGFMQKSSISFSIITPTSHKKYYRKLLREME